MEYSAREIPNASILVAILRPCGSTSRLHMARPNTKNIAMSLCKRENREKPSYSNYFA
ncbi:hypothetical protein BDV19DRAFT_374680, partial [Aspergillus venezuelensis]